MISLDALPSASVGSASTDSTALDGKRQGEIPDGSKRHSLNLLHINNYLQQSTCHLHCVRYHKSSRDDLKYMDVLRPYANTTPSCGRDLSIRHPRILVSAGAGALEPFPRRY